MGAMKASKLKPLERVLIVGEGKKTEPYYFDAFKQDYRLTSVTIKLSKDSAPISVVQAAIEFYTADAGYDYVYCVIDRDEHESFDRAIQLANRARREHMPIEVIPSFPCFEFWLYLHFERTRSPFVRKGKISPCACLSKALKSRPNFAQYDHGFKQSYERTKAHLETAIQNAKWAERDAKATGEANPSTEIYRVVERLLSLKSND